MTATIAPRPSTNKSAPIGPSHEEGGFQTLLRHTLVFARRNLEHTRQIPEKLLDVTVQPVMFVLLFAFVFGGAINVKGSSYREYLIGGILIQSLAFGLVGPGMAIATDLTEGVIDRFRSLPTSRFAYLLGHYVAEMAGTILSVAVLLTTGFIVGWRSHSGVGNTVQALLLLVAFGSSMVWIGTWIGMMVRSPDAVQGVGFTLVFPLTFLSNAFVPLETLPNALQWIAAWNPISVMVAAVRELFGNPAAPLTKNVWPLHHPVVSAWAYCALMLVIAVPGALRRYGARTAD
jgi:ABC-2 type transport system permease protein